MRPPIVVAGYGGIASQTAEGVFCACANFAVSREKSTVWRKKMVGHIHSIESCGTVDGPGLRFVVFVKGCPMRCQYCHNPDTWEMSGGTDMTVEEIMDQFNHKKDFYKKGGITVTGGEPLVQIDFVTELFRAAKAQGVHTCLDTSGITFKKDNPAVIEKFDRLMEVTDLVMLDIKHIDPEEHIKLTKQKNDEILAFAHYIDEKGVEIWIRHVVVEGITLKEEYLKRLGQFMATLRHVKALDVLPYHNMGEVKYENLGIDYPLKGMKSLDKSKAVWARGIILQAYREERNKMANGHSEEKNS